MNIFNAEVASVTVTVPSQSLAKIFCDRDLQYIAAQLNWIFNCLANNQKQP